MTTRESAPKKRVNRAADRPIVGQTYRHYKGDLYTVEAVAFHHETRKKMVVYRSHKYGWRNVRPLHGMKSDPDGWLTPVKNEQGNELIRFQPTNLVLLLEEEDGTWLGVCQAFADMRQVRGKTLVETQKRLRHQWAHPLPRRFPEDLPLMDSEFESMMGHGKLYEIDPLFTWFVLDQAARENNLRTALNLPARTTPKGRR
jgi:hypothetical protein